MSSPSGCVKIMDSDLWSTLRERGMTEPRDRTDLVDLDAQIWRWVNHASSKEKAKDYAREVTMVEAIEKLDCWKKICEKYANDETTSFASRKQFLSELKEMTNPKTYKALQKKISDTGIDNLNRFSTHLEGYWDQTFPKDAKPSENDAPSGKPKNYFWWFPVMGCQGQIIEERKMAGEFWLFAAYAPKEQSKTLIKAILAKRAKESIETTVKELEEGKFEFNQYYPERNTEIITTLLGQVADPVEVAKIVDWRVRLLIKGLDSGDRFSGWFRTTFAADVFPRPDDWIPEELKRLATPVMGPGGTMAFMTLSGDGDDPLAKFFADMRPCTEEDFGEKAQRKWDMDQM